MKTMLNKSWMLFFAFCSIAIQFFYVLGKYEIIESEKVFWWVLKYFLPLYLVVALFIKRGFTKLLLYSTPKLQPSDVSKSTRAKNQLASIGLFLLMSNFFTYNSIILTNDWFGSGKHELIITEVLDVEYERIGSSRINGKGNEKWIISLNYKGKIIRLTTQKPWYPGDTFEMTLNTGGCWNILFVG